MIWLMELDYNPLIVVAVLGLVVVVLGSWFSPLFSIVRIPLVGIHYPYRYLLIWFNIKSIPIIMKMNIYRGGYP